VIEIRQTNVFKKWIQELKDSMARARINQRIDRLSRGNAGDVRPIGDGCSEMRITYGPGYRVYYKDTGKEIIILLCGGDKSTQHADIIKARQLVREAEGDYANE